MRRSEPTVFVVLSLLGVLVATNGIRHVALHVDASVYLYRGIYRSDWRRPLPVEPNRVSGERRSRPLRSADVLTYGGGRGNILDRGSGNGRLLAAFEVLGVERECLFGVEMNRAAEQAGGSASE